MSNQGGAMGIGSESYEVESSTVHEIEKDTLGREASSSDPSVQAEKGDIIDVNEDETDENENLNLSHEEQFPIDPNAEEETHQFTVRAVFVGCCLGGVIAASKYAVLCESSRFPSITESHAKISPASTLV